MLIRMQSSLQLIPMFDLVDEVIEPSIVRKSRGGRLYCRIKSLLRTWLSRVPPLSSIRSTSNVALPDCTLEFACEFNVSHRDTGGGGSLAASEPPFKPPFEPVRANVRANVLRYVAPITAHLCIGNVKGAEHCLA